MGDTVRLGGEDDDAIGTDDGKPGRGGTCTIGTTTWSEKARLCTQ